MNVLVTNAKNRIAYNIVKSLSRKGHKVHCADFVPRAMTYYSRYSSGNFLYPSPFSEQDEFVECLIRKIRELKIDVLIPVFEELFLIAKYKNKFINNVKLAIPDYDQILTMHNKDRWEPIANELGIPVPKTFSIKELKADTSLIEKIVYPVLLKPKQGGGGWGIGEVATLDELTGTIETGIYQGIDLGRYIVQQKIDGETICVAMVFNTGKLCGKTTYRQVREYPFFNGQATCRVSISNKSAENHLQKLLEHLNWHGVCQVDFVVEKDTGTPYLIDINPRFWGSLVQAIASGVDFPHLVCEIAAHGNVKAVSDFRLGVQTRWLGGDLRGFCQHLIKSKEKGAFLSEFFWPEKPVELYDDLSIDDPLPFAAWCWDSFFRLLKYRRNKPHESLDGIWQ